VIHHLCPTRIAQPRGFLGGPDDIDKEDRGERLFELGATIGGSAPDRNIYISSQRFIAMIASRSSSIGADPKSKSCANGGFR
jgi:hypothetical protein